MTATTITASTTPTIEIDGAERQAGHLLLTRNISNTNANGKMQAAMATARIYNYGHWFTVWVTGTIAEVGRPFWTMEMPYNNFRIHTMEEGATLGEVLAMAESLLDTEEQLVRASLASLEG
jgi:hypothetical protein